MPAGTEERGVRLVMSPMEQEVTERIYSVQLKTIIRDQVNDAPVPTEIACFSMLL